jgi:hypothetical protein
MSKRKEKRLAKKAARHGSRKTQKRHNVMRQQYRADVDHARLADAIWNSSPKQRELIAYDEKRMKMKKAVKKIHKNTAAAFNQTSSWGRGVGPMVSSEILMSLPTNY